MDKDYHIVLYITKRSDRTRELIKKAREVMDSAGIDKSHLEIVDILSSPERAEKDKVFAVPTLIRVKPEPVKKVFGSLKDIEKVKKELGLG